MFFNHFALNSRTHFGGIQAYAPALSSPAPTLRRSKQASSGALYVTTNDDVSGTGPLGAVIPTTLVIHPVKLVGDAIKAMIEAAGPDLGPVRSEPVHDLAAQLDTTQAELMVCAVMSREDAAIVIRHALAHPTTRLIALVEHADGDLIARLVDSGVRGVITGATNGAVAISVLRLVLAGGVYVPQTHGLAEAHGGMDGAPRRGTASDALTRRQRQVLQELGGGLSNRAIAQRLGMQESTVKAHVKQIIKRLGVDNRTQAALIAAGRAASLPAAAS